MRIKCSEDYILLPYKFTEDKDFFLFLFLVPNKCLKK